MGSARLPVSAVKKWNQLSSKALAIGASSTAPMPLGPALPNCPDKWQTQLSFSDIHGWLYCVSQGKFRVSFLSAAAGKGEGQLSSGLQVVSGGYGEIILRAA